MKPEKWISALAGAVLAFLLSFGGMGCLISAFDMEVGMAGLLLGCAVFSLAGALCYLLKRGDAIIACVSALVLGYLWRRGTLVSSFETLAYVISQRYDGGYDCGILGRYSGTVTAAVMITGALIALAAARTVCRRDTSIPALTLALVPLLLCVVVTDTVPKERYLFLLLLGMILLLLTGNLRRSDPGQANTLLAMAAIPAVLALLALFWAAPKDSYVNRTEDIQDTLVAWAAGVPELWEDLTTSEDTVSANDDRTPRVDLDSLGPRKRYTYAVMDVFAETGGVLYLREQDYNNYQNSGWTYSVSREEYFGKGTGVEWESAGMVTITTRRVRDVFYYPYYPAEDVLLKGGCVVNDGEQTAYEVERYVLPGNWEQHLSEPEADDSRLEFPVGSASSVNYTKLPQDTREWAEELLTTILTDEVTDTEKAEAIARYVRNSARYDLNTPRMDEDAEDFVRWFLEESDTGYCVHFATAAAVLLRAAGVDARYVTGYMVPAKAGETVTVTAERAHAWVEYYESRLDAWIVLEATPPDLTEEPGDPTQETDAAPTGAEDTQPQNDPEETESGEGTESTDAQENTGTGDPDDSGDNPGGKRRGGGWWLLLVLIPGGLWAQRELRMGIRRQRMHRGGANSRCLALWQEVCRYGRVLKRRPPGELEALAQKAKFSQHTLTTQELMTFDAWLREQRRQFRGKPWYLRLLLGCIYAV